MKRWLSIILILSLNASGGFAAFSYYRTVTVDYTKVTSPGQSGFPVLVSGTYNGSGGILDLRTVGNGGKVQNANGYDIGFYTNADCSTGKMNWEMEQYNATTGNAQFWMNVASLSSSADTVFYICYGDSGISTDQSNPTSVWDSNYKVVQHLNDAASSVTTQDSTSNNNDGAATSGMAAGTGKIAGGAQYPVSNTVDNIVITDNAGLHISQPLTISVWSNVSSNVGYNNLFGKNYYTAYTEQIAYNPFYQIFDWSDSAGTVHETYPTTYTKGNWHYAVLRVTGGHTYVYLDGSLFEDMTNGASPNYLNSNVNLLIGGDGGSYTAPIINGIADEARVSNVARTADWIATEYANQNSPSTFYTLGAESTPGGGGGAVPDNPRKVIIVQ